MTTRNREYNTPNHCWVGTGVKVQGVGNKIKKKKQSKRMKEMRGG